MSAKEITEPSVLNSTNEVVTDFLSNISSYSSIIISFSIIVLSVSISSPMKGMIYIGWVMISSFVRICILMMVSDGNEPTQICKKGSLPGFLQKYDGGRNSIFNLCFNFFYICFPMFISKNINWYFVWTLLVYIIFDCSIKFRMGCIADASVMLGEIFGGSLFGVMVSGIMFYLGLSKYLFVNEMNSNKEVCSVAGKQTFRCSVYKNGEIISSSDTT